MNSFVLRSKKNGVSCAHSLCTGYPKISMSDLLYMQAISKTLTAFKSPFQVYLLALTSPSALTLRLIRASFTRKTGNSQNQTGEKAKGSWHLISTVRNLLSIFLGKCSPSEHVSHFQCEFLLLFPAPNAKDSSKAVPCDTSCSQIKYFTIKPYSPWIFPSILNVLDL